MLPPLHELLVDDFAGIIFARLDVHGLFDDGVRAAAKGLARAILGAHSKRRSAEVWHESLPGRELSAAMWVACL